MGTLYCSGYNADTTIHNMYISIYVYLYIYIYIDVEGTFLYRMTGFGKKPYKTYNNCPNVNFDFICRRSTLSHFHLVYDDLNYYSIGKASLKSDLHIHILFNGSLNSWLHFRWLSFKFAVKFTGSCPLYISFSKFKFLMKLSFPVPSEICLQRSISY